MKYRLLDYVVCPDCGEELKLKVFKEERVENVVIGDVKNCNHSCALKQCVKEEQNNGIDCNECCRLEIKEGVLECKNGHIFPIADHIPRMLPDAFYALNDFLEKYKHHLFVEKIERRMKGVETRKFIKVHRNTKISFGYEWLKYGVDLEGEDREVFLRDSQFSKEFLKDKVILDAGCGMGRYTRIAGEMGSEIIGVDLSLSVLKAHQVTHDNPFAHIVQGDILNLPFREKQFDVVYSLGVLHHTPDAKRSFLNLTRYLKEGGLISVWVYGTAGKYREFKTNPLREDRRRYIKNKLARRLHWITVYVREMLLDFVRLFTTRMYVPLLYLLCYPLAAVGKIPLLKYLTASAHNNWRVRLQENFDWFSPQYQSHHTKEEILGWFNEVKLDDISMLRHGFIPKVGLRGKLE